jgi:hypothetical protein
MAFVNRIPAIVDLVGHDREAFSSNKRKMLRDHERDRGDKGIFRAKRARRGRRRRLS